MSEYDRMENINYIIVIFFILTYYIVLLSRPHWFNLRYSVVIMFYNHPGSTRCHETVFHIIIVYQIVYFNRYRESRESN